MDEVHGCLCGYNPSCLAPISSFYGIARLRMRGPSVSYIWGGTLYGSCASGHGVFGIRSASGAYRSSRGPSSMMHEPNEGSMTRTGGSLSLSPFLQMVTVEKRLTICVEDESRKLLFLFSRIVCWFIVECRRLGKGSRRFGQTSTVTGTTRHREQGL